MEDVVRNGIFRMLDESALVGFDSSVRVNFPKIPKWVYVLLAIFTCYVLFAGYISFESRHLSTKLSRIKKERALLEEQWKPIEQQMKIVEQMEQDKKTLESLTAQTVPLRHLIEALSTTTPKDTWVNNLILTQGNKIILRGDSKSAVLYMGELSKIAGFKDVKFISPVRKDAGADKEFFNIEITVDWNEFKQARPK
jgi:Tfp pilus assembly protein PilN